MAANYQLLVQGFLQQFSLDMLCKGDREGALFAEVQSRLQDRLQTKILDMMGRLVGELFTDDELDQLIVVYKMPVSQKVRESVPIMQREVLNLLGSLDFDRLAKEIMAEFE